MRNVWCYFTAASMLAVSLSSTAGSQPHKVPVMTLGVFHFAYPNLDVQKTEKKDQINVLDERRQQELGALVAALMKFHPTRIAVEQSTTKQRYIDSLYALYRTNAYKAGKNEVEQVDFRLAKELNLPKVYCVDDWGKTYDHLDFLSNDTLPRTQAFVQYYFSNPDSVYRTQANYRSARQPSIGEILAAMNDRQRIKNDLGNYLIGHFKYEETPGDYIGADFEAGRWFDRNLRILRNIQRIPVGAEDRILVIYGSGHLNILNYLFECSPEYELVDPVPYLTGH